METFYITYSNRSTSTEHYPYNIEMGSLDEYEIAERFILHHINAIIKSNDSSYHFYYPNLLITNDKSLNQKYKFVLDLNEFKLFCNIYERYNSLTSYEKYLADEGVSGDFGKEVFINFEKLLAKEGNRVYQSFEREIYNDEINGGSHTLVIENGWKFEKNNYINKLLKDELNQNYWIP